MPAMRTLVGFCQFSWFISFSFVLRFSYFTLCACVCCVTPWRIRNILHASAHTKVHTISTCICISTCILLLACHNIMSPFNIQHTGAHTHTNVIICLPRVATGNALCRAMLNEMILSPFIIQSVSFHCVVFISLIVLKKLSFSF